MSYECVVENKCNGFIKDFDTFYVKEHCDYGECIIMETDGDLVKVVAEEMEFFEYKDL